jgi:3-dehydroquinate synthase
MIHFQQRVRLGDRSYPIYAGYGMLSLLTQALRRQNIRDQIVILTDERVAQHYLASVQRELHKGNYHGMSLIIPPGERQKNLARASGIYTAMISAGIGRESALLTLGGGVIGDLGGFIAATYLRGVDLIHVPTTLLAQVDSSIGGKVGVNHPLGKNSIGAFYQPKLVWSDAKYLQTLPDREIRCGLAEIVKYGIMSDQRLYSYLEANLERLLKLDQESILRVVSRCVEIKSDIVAQDERESGKRMWLNLGHTVGHALETVGKYRALKHGEAVLMGILAESSIAHEIGILSAKHLARIVNLVTRIPLPKTARGLNGRAVLKALGRDKKSLDGSNRFVLPRRIGNVKVVKNVDPSRILQSLKYLNGVLEHPRAMFRVGD